MPIFFKSTLIESNSAGGIPVCKVAKVVAIDQLVKKRTVTSENIISPDHMSGRFG